MSFPEALDPVRGRVKIGDIEVDVSPGHIAVRPVAHALELDRYGHKREAGPIFGEVVAIHAQTFDLAEIGLIVVLRRSSDLIWLHQQSEIVVIARGQDVACIVSRSEASQKQGTWACGCSMLVHPNQKRIASDWKDSDPPAGHCAFGWSREAQK